jgi:Zinc knuckle
MMCFDCGIVGHYARDCEKRKVGKKLEKTLVATAVQDDEVEEERDEWYLTLVTSAEHALFSKHEILLDNEASISVFQNKELLTKVRRSEKLGGIQRGAAGVRDLSRRRNGVLQRFGISEIFALCLTNRRRSRHYLR